MKHILMALAITAFAYSGVEAQGVYCKTKTTTVTRHTVPQTSTVVTTENCRVVPYRVCTIQPDGQHVNCYKTTDLDNFTPMDSSDVTYFGPTGDVPGQVERSNVETTIIRGAPKADYCKRNEDTKTTTCVYSGWRIARDPDGFYRYEQIQR
jgi:hypothetical protein